MFFFAIAIGFYSYFIFILGAYGFLYKNTILLGSILFVTILSSVFYKRNLISPLFLIIKKGKRKDRFTFFILLLIILQVVVNFIGVLGPELSFDALWYHLVLPKLFLQEHRIFHIPGGLLYYSDMPKLAEMLYIPVLVFGNEIAAKTVHFIFGILSSVVTYKIARLFSSSKLSLLAAAIFYSNLVVGWESITAYIDLTRTFFETLALLGFLLWYKRKKIHWFLISSLMVGFAVTTKLLAIGSLIIFSALFLYCNVMKKQKDKSLTTNTLVYWCISILIPLPWFIFSYVNTGNPIYPFFTDLYPVGISAHLFNPLEFLKDIFTLFTHANDPISPLYLLFFLFIPFLFKKFSREEKLIFYYSLMSLFLWYIMPKTGGGRFILPYLPAFSVLTVVIMHMLIDKKRSIFMYALVFFSLASSIMYRGVANAKYLPVIFGSETKNHFLSTRLNFSFGDFYDIDGFFRKNIHENDMVLLYGFHNLYYIDFPFIDSSWVKPGDKFNFIATQNTTVPLKFSEWMLIHENKKTHVKLYTDNRKVWYY